MMNAPHKHKHKIDDVIVVSYHHLHQPHKKGKCVSLSIDCAKRMNLGKEEDNRSLLVKHQKYAK
jgi:hypothetical protein